MRRSDTWQDDGNDYAVEGNLGNTSSTESEGWNNMMRNPEEIRVSRGADADMDLYKAAVPPRGSNGVRGPRLELGS